ncbi:MAG: glycoside hydrolase family 25 protein [Lachnospiraceae bacterium]|nr:glycoside hydrolase family 25 protein [Lachnospiraceae bacterium]
MSKPAKRFFTILIMLIIIGMVALIILLNVKFDKSKPVFISTAADEREWYLEPGAVAGLIDDNYWSYVRASYVLIGDYPNYEYYKIAANVPRNDYEVDNFFIDDENGLMYYHNDNAERISHVAVDVSAYQTDVDWEKVKAAGVDMAIIRAGYRGYGSGALVTDDMFQNHIEGALDAGLIVGVYFFTQAINYDEGVEEAKYTLNLIKDYKVKGPVIIDSEIIYDDAARTAELDIDSRTDSVVGFCETVKNAGYEPMIYSNRNWFVQELDMSRVGNYRLWLAHYSNQPDFPYLYTAWQYTDEGSLSGIGINLDLNVWIE